MKTKTLLEIFTLSGLLLLLLLGCQKEETTALLPTVKITAVSYVSVTSAVIEGDVVSYGGTPVIASGLCWSTHENPTVADNITSNGLDMKGFNYFLFGLNGNTFYYLRAYITTNAGIVYSNSVYFKTLPGSPIPTQSGTTTPFEPVTDIDGNSYNILVLGTQTWMVENLKTTRYRNGDQVPNFTTRSTKGDFRFGADNIFYNWYAVSDFRGLAPAGWHVPSSSEWITLLDYASGKNTGVKRNAYDWLSDMGFDMTYIGWSYSGGVVLGLGMVGYWWSSDQLSVTIQRECGPMIWLQEDNCEREIFYSVRCVKD